MSTVAVVGLGSIGTIFAAHLIAGARHRVFACVRQPLDMLRLETADGRLEVPVRCVTEPGAVETVDWVLLATKTQDTAGAVPWFERLCGTETRVVVLQNGVDHEARLAVLRGPARTVPTVVFANGKRVAKGHVRHLSPGDDLVLPDNAEGRSTVDLFAGTALHVRTAADFTTECWWKFLANLVANPLTAITGRGIEVVRGGEMEQLALTLLREATAVGRACGARLEDDTPERVLKWMSKYPGDTGTSMLQDYKDGRPLEHEALTGAVVRLGREHGISIPLNAIIRTLLEAMSMRH